MDDKFVKPKPADSTLPLKVCGEFVVPLPEIKLQPGAAGPPVVIVNSWSEEWLDAEPRQQPEPVTWAAVRETLLVLGVVFGVLGAACAATYLSSYVWAFFLEACC